MVRNPNISSLSELRERKKELRMDMELSKREFAHSIGTNRSNVSNFLLKKVAAPVGGAGLALLFLNKVLSSSGSDKGRETIRETRVIHQYPDGKPVAAAENYAARAAGPNGLTRREKKKLFSIATIASLAKVVIPIIQAIIGTITAHKAEEHARQAKKAARK